MKIQFHFADHSNGKIKRLLRASSMASSSVNASLELFLLTISIVFAEISIIYDLDTNVEYI